MLIKPSIKFSLLLVGAFSLTLQVSTYALAGQPPPKSAVSVQPAFGQDPSARFQLEIVMLGLKRLGYDVKKPNGMAGPAFANLAVAQGDADFYAQFWDTLQRPIYERNGVHDRATLIGSLVDDAAQGYQIDKKTSEKYGITHLEQLRDPELAKLFDTDGNGKADLIGCQPGWGCDVTIPYQMDAYGLEDTVEVHSGQFTPLHVEVVSRYKQGNSVLF